MRRPKAIVLLSGSLLVVMGGILTCLFPGQLLSAAGGGHRGQDDPPRSDVMPIGTNLDGLSYWSPALPLVDLMKSAGTWVAHADTAFDTHEPVAQDGSGWVRHYPVPGSGTLFDSVLVNILHDNPAAPPHARYMVSFDGEGTIEPALGARLVLREPHRLIVEAADQGGLYLQLRGTGADRDDYIRNIRIVRLDLLPFQQAGLSFNPDFIERIRPFHILRFMDWMNSNMIYDRQGHAIADADRIGNAPLLDWIDRPKPQDRSWGESGHGMPVETMVELANRIGAEPWFNMPINASDDYVRGFATYVRDHLQPGIPIHVELSNEVWNWVFPQSHYAQARANALFGPGANWLEWYGVRAAQMAMIWKTVFGQPLVSADRAGRVKMVFGTQFAWKGLETNGLDTKDWRDDRGRPARAADYFDEYAITGYYGGIASDDGDYDRVRAWWRDPDGGFGRAIDALRARIADYNAPLYRYHADVARRYGLRLVTYESGFGEVTPPSHQDDQAYTDFLARLQRRPEIGALEQQNYRAFQSAGGALFMNFGIIGTPSKWGSWSALETVGQAHSPRYDALRGWAQANMPWQGDARRAAIYAGARIVKAGDAGAVIEGTRHGYDILIGGRGDDRFIPHGGDETRMIGGGGHDLLMLSGPRQAYHFAPAEPDGVRISGPDGTIVASGIETVRFGGTAPTALDGLASAGR